MPFGKFALAFKVATSPKQIVVFEVEATGIGFTKTVALAVSAHPCRLYITVYVDVLFGVTVMELLMDGSGDHVKFPPVKSTVLEIVVLEPKQIVSLTTLTIGLGLTMISAVTLGATHPLELVNTTEYVVFVVGAALKEAVVAPVDHKYVPPTETLETNKVPDCPRQILSFTICG